MSVGFLGILVQEQNVSVLLTEQLISKKVFL